MSKSSTGKRITVGQEMIWVYSAHPKLGYTFRVPCQVVKIGRSRVLVAARLSKGAERLVSVKRKNLKKTTA